VTKNSCATRFDAIAQSVIFVPSDTKQPSYAGHITVWFGASLNKNNSVFHDTFNAAAEATA
jgi:hypothetical protein